MSDDDLFGRWRHMPSNRCCVAAPCNPPPLENYQHCIKLTWNGDVPGYRGTRESVHHGPVMRELIADGVYVRNDEPDTITPFT